MLYSAPSVVCLLAGTAASAMVCMYNPEIIEIVINPANTLWNAFGFGDYVMLILALFAKSCVCLALFNLIPVHPMDMSKILLTFLPQQTAAKMTQREKIFQIVLILALAIGFVGLLFDPVAHMVLRSFSLT
jgi:Zn-dependent protease